MDYDDPFPHSCNLPHYWDKVFSVCDHENSVQFRAKVGKKAGQTFFYSKKRKEGVTTGGVRDWTGKSMGKNRDKVFYM
ncbi:hypothetical protein HW35_11100 [Bacillus sp. X1(2014)]|nr:hypothetical protein HW35_11100 [Bacillus sp. X1(2014)]